MEKERKQDKCSARQMAWGYRYLWVSFRDSRLTALKIALRKTLEKRLQEGKKRRAKLRRCRRWRHMTNASMACFIKNMETFLHGMLSKYTELTKHIDLLQTRAPSILFSTLSQSLFLHYRNSEIYNKNFWSIDHHLVKLSSVKKLTCQLKYSFKHLSGRGRE